MTKETGIKVFSSVLIFIAWISETILYDMSKNNVIVLLSFICCVFIGCFCKNQSTRLVFSIIASAFICICSADCIFYTIPALMVIMAYCEETYLFNENNGKTSASKRKKNKQKDRMTGTYLIFGCIFTFVGFLMIIFGDNRNSEEIEIALMRSIDEFIVLLIVIAFMISKNKGKAKKSGMMNNIYIITVVGLIETFSVSLVNVSIDAEKFRYIFSFWFIFVIVISIKEDIFYKNRTYK